MAVHIHNTMSRKVERLTSDGSSVRMFVCGPTVYDYAHIGHAKTYTQFDLIARFLRFRGCDVHYIQNITDIDDKIIQRAAVTGVTPDDLASRFEAAFLEDMSRIGNTSVDTYARALDYVPEIQGQVAILARDGYAYPLNDGYYFDTTTFEHYGQLSGRVASIRTDAVSRIDQNADKRNPADFCVWKFRKEGEPYWHAPFGNGRPGWHIEDTAITEHFFGSQYEIHGGAIDLIFPHHEAEIALMESISGLRPMVQHWLHTGFLNFGEQKMSKSTGNFITIRDLLDRVNYRVLRFLFLSQHYRSSLEFHDGTLTQAVNGLRRLDTFVGSVAHGHDDRHLHAEVKDMHQAFLRGLDNDFDCPIVIAALFQFVKKVNRAGGAGSRVWRLLQDVNTVFAFLDMRPPVRVAEIERLLRERDELRAAGRYREADAIRQRIVVEYEVIIEDGEEGTHWRRSSGS